MAMQIQRGLVKYKDRSDIVCIYGITDSGMQYYFLEDGRLANGNVIVTTTLLEAVDPMATASNIGVIDGNGNVVVPCENKSIKVITDDIILVERAQPASESVLEAIRLREDPLAATKLVTTPATIKDNMNGLMGENGRFIFNDQFSEATIFDIYGNNLANNEYYSFIGLNDQKLFYSKNTIDSEVQEYPLYPIDNEIMNNEPTSNINVENAEVTKDDIDNSLNNPVQAESPINEVETTNTVYEEPVGYEETYYEESMPVTGENVEEPISTEETYTEEVVVPDENVSVDVNEQNLEDDSFELPDVDVNAAMSLGEVDAEPSEVIEKQEEVAPVEEEVNEEIPEEAKTINIGVTDENTEEEPINEDTEVEETEEKDDKDYDIDELVKRVDAKIAELEALEKSTKVSNADNLESNEYNYEDDEYDDEDSYETDDYNYDEYDDYSVEDAYDYSSVVSGIGQNNLFDDVTSTISNLVELNKNLQSMVDDYEVKYNKCNAARKKLAELSRSQAREINSLKAKVARLETDKQILETKLSALTPSSNGELARAMKDAQNMIGKTQSRMRRKKNI